ncbi:MAG: hypothetical protein WD005_04820 [Haliea sp.]
MRTIHLCVAYIVFSFFLSGCAIGNQYDYGNREISLPIEGGGEIGLAVIDSRDYVVSGSKPENFIGIQRGGFGNPFNVTTSSGNSLAADFSNSLKNALGKGGFEVKEIYLSSPDSSLIAEVLQKDGSGKNLVLKVKEWKTDAMARLRLIFDLELSIYDGQGEILASVRDKGDEVISGAGFEGGNSSNAGNAFEIKIGRLFNRPEIRDELAQ